MIEERIKTAKQTIKKGLRFATLTVNELTLPNSKLKYYCPCCDFKIKNFYPYYHPSADKVCDPNRYVNKTEGLVCPFCHSLPRHRILVNYFRHHRTLISGDKKILYFAIEEGVKRWLDRKNIAYESADLYDEKAMLQINIEDTGLPENSYDVIVCNHVLEHVNSYQKALNELRRILKPEGVLIISFPIDESYETLYEDSSITDSEERRIHFGQVDHLRIFGMDSEALLEAYGFSVQRIRGEDCPSSYLAKTGPANYDENYLFECKLK